MRKPLLYSRKPTNKCRRKGEARKSSTDVKTSRLKSNEDIYSLNTSPHKLIINYKEKISNIKEILWMSPKLSDPS